MHALASTPPDPGPVDETRLGTLFDHHAKSLIRAALRVVGNESDAEDAVQSVFLRLLRREDTIDLDHPGVGGYLHRASVNAALDLLRQRRRAALDDGDDASTAPDRDAGPSRRLEAKEAARALRQAMAELSPRAAEMFTLRYFQELSNQQIAEFLDTSPGVVAVTLHRSRHQLKGLLGSLLGDAS